MNLELQVPYGVDDYLYRMRVGEGVPAIGCIVLEPSVRHIDGCATFASRLEMASVEVCFVFNTLGSKRTGPHNLEFILDMAKCVSYVVCAWEKAGHAYSSAIKRALMRAGVDLRVLGLSRGGAPLPINKYTKGLSLRPWAAAEAFATDPQWWKRLPQAGTP